MLRIAFGLLSLFCCSALCQNSVASRAPPKLPFFDWKACPFEGCSYRGWKAKGHLAVYNSWRGNRRMIAHLSSGDSVQGIRGVVITFRPGRIRMDRDVPEQGLKRGSTIFTYAYRGEGTSAVWFQGRYYSDFDISYAKWPSGGGCNGKYCAATYVDLGKKVWWAQVQLRSGVRAWVKMDDLPFDGVNVINP